MKPKRYSLVSFTSDGPGELREAPDGAFVTYEEYQRLARLRSAVKNFIAAWDGLSIGDHSPRDVDRWLNGPAMVATISALKAALADAKADGAFTADDAWDNLINKDDRTSPEEYPEMALITRDELADYMRRAEGKSHD